MRWASTHTHMLKAKLRTIKRKVKKMSEKFKFIYSSQISHLTQSEIETLNNSVVVSLIMWPLHFLSVWVLPDTRVWSFCKAIDDSSIPNKSNFLFSLAFRMYFHSLLLFYQVHHKHSGLNSETDSKAKKRANQFTFN